LVSIKNLDTNQITWATASSVSCAENHLGFGNAPSKLFGF